jgi:DNA polymerase-3 subunit gamma/tau
LAGKALDIIEIDAASHTGVDNVRENIINNARFTPTKNKYKVFIIDEVHMLSISAFNALLKILEEPPKYVIFVLATTEAHKVPATIISRCQRFDFKKIIISELIERLRWITTQEEVSVEDAVLSLIASHAGGCVRDAESLLEQVLSLGEKNITLEQAELILPKSDFGSLFTLFDHIVRNNKSAGLNFIGQLVADGVDIGLFTDNFIEFVRRILVYKVTNSMEELSREMDESIMKQVIELVKSVPEARLVEIIEKCLVTKETYKQNFIVQLPLEMAVVELTGLEKPSTIPEPQVETTQSVPPVTPVSPVETPVEPTPSETPVSPASPEPSRGVTPTPPVAHESTPVTPAPPVSHVSPEPEPIRSLEAVMVLWPNVLNKIKQEHYSLYMSLHMGKPVAVVDGKVKIGFLFELQRARVDEMRSKEILQDALISLGAHGLGIEAIVDPSLSLKDLPKNGNGGAPSAPPSPEDEVSNVANAFGGEVVN